MTLTIEQFRSTKKWSDNLAVDCPFHAWDEDEARHPIGFMYMGTLYVERVQDTWPDKAREQGDWYLIIGNCEYITKTIEPLEQKLFEFALSEGYSMEEISK